MSLKEGIIALTQPAPASGFSHDPIGRVTALAAHLPRPWRFWLPAVALALLGALVIIDTYDMFSHTWDEPAHIAGGMELLDNGTYNYEPLHPPFGRTATALGPRLAGLHYAGEENIWIEGQNILYDQGSYWRTLTLARVGTLPFFILAALMTGLMARQFFGTAAGVGAAALFVTTPAMLGLGGLAITDVTMTAFYLAAVLAFIRWLETGKHGDAALLGLTSGLAVMSKYSAIPYLALTFLAILGLRWALASESPLPLLKTRRLRLGIELSVVAVIVTIWAVHGFLFAETDTARRMEQKFASAEEAESVAPPEETAAKEAGGENTTVLPLFIKSVGDGLASVINYNAKGKETYFLGEWRKGGHPLFFPVTLGVKLPLPLLLLGVAGLGLTVSYGIRRRQWRALVPASAFVLILGLGMISNLNYGLRHVLPLVPLLCVAAAGGVVAALSMLSSRGRPAQIGMAALTGALFLWQAIGTARAHPDHLAYFNALAGDRPERIVILGDLDWGQDMHRLSQKLERLGVDRFHLLYMGSGLPGRHGLPPFEPLDPNGPPVTGWVVTHPRVSALFPEKLRWLREHEPVARAGKTFRIYRLPESAPARAGDGRPR